MKSVKLTLAVIYASTTGNTEFAVDTLCDQFDADGSVRILIKQRAEQTKAEDLLKADVLLLASGSWNTGGAEGQLNPHMYRLLKERSNHLMLAGKPCAVIGLGDDRYFYTARAADELTAFILARGGKLMLPALMVVNEPYDQKEKIRHFADECLKHIAALPVSVEIE